MFTYISVDITEHERGWGSKLDSTKYFRGDEMDKAKAFVQQFNSGNTEPSAPDWYMVAHQPVVHQLPDEVVAMFLEAQPKAKNPVRKKRVVKKGK